MGKKPATSNGKGRLEEALETLIQSQAVLVQNQAQFISRMADIERESAERFARIERDMASILRVLAEHSRLLERLPEAVRAKIGFQASE